MFILYAFLVLFLPNFSSQNPILSFNVTRRNNYEQHKTIRYPFILEDPAVGKSFLGFFNEIKKYYLPLTKYIDNEDCKSLVNLNYIENFSEGLDSWSLKMTDAWGKLPDGFLFGNIQPVGMYEECIFIEARSPSVSSSEEGTPFRGKYCTIYYREKSGTGAKSGPGLAVLSDTASFHYATCIPSLCTDKDLYTSLNITLGDLNREISSLECREKERPNYFRKFDGFDGFVSGLLLLLLTLATCGTIIDERNSVELFPLSSTVRIVLEWLTYFSITRNFKYIFKYETSSRGKITCMHGMRAITIVWIMTCHQYETAVDFIANLFNAPMYQDPVFAQAITNGYPSVDTFFVLSGILLAYRLFPLFHGEKGVGTSIPSYLKGFCISFFRRFMRLCPSIFMVAVFCATLLRYTGWGFRLSKLETTVDECRETWWRDPIFINNLFLSKENYKRDCLQHCWYTAIEMQLFLISPLVFLPFLFVTLGGYYFLAFLTVMSSLIPMIIVIVNEFPPIIFISQLKEKGLDFTLFYYQVPWCRSTPWFIGIWAGIILALQPRMLRPYTTKVNVILGYLLAIGLGLAVVLGLYRYNHQGYHWDISVGVSTVYTLFSREAWALAVSFVVITCHLGVGGYVNNILSWWGWQPLSRLSFCMYLIGIEVQKWWSSGLFLPVYYSYTSKLFETCGTFFLTFVLAVLLCVLVERPFLLMSNKLSSSKVIPKK